MASALNIALRAEGHELSRGRLRVRDGFTSREGEILQLVAAGFSNKQVAEELGISIKTVGTHLERLYRRRQLRSRTEAVVAWLWRESKPGSGGLR